MPDQIDYKFLSDLEGGCKTTGYVPVAALSKSGVTVATGFDLGQRNQSDLTRLGLPMVLVIKLKPYLGKRGKDAVDLLKKSPLIISSEQGKTIDKAVKSVHVQSLKTHYASSPHNAAKKAFFDLPAEAQTVITSVSFQYGANLNVSAPKFWKAASSQDWATTVAVLRAFGDIYPTRRNKEAALLGKLIP